MKKFTRPIIYSLVLVALFLQSCIKDRVPSPGTINVPQTVIYSQNFDSSIASLPAGWSASPSGWAIDTSNASNAPAIGYSGGSGLSNVSISDPTSGGGGSFNLTSASYSTIGYTNITVTYAARRSKHYSDNGSSVALYWSIDDGKTWNLAIYTENAADSDWHIVNGGARISLPAAAAGQANLMLQWTANVVATPSGSYRIDDFQIFGSK